MYTSRTVYTSTRSKFVCKSLGCAEVSMNSVERIKYYSEVEQEGLKSSHALDPPIGWPSHPRIAFQNVSAAYRVGLKNAISGLSMTIEAGQKVAFVGRTGSGTSQQCDWSTTQ
eukprot:SAG11_NODE_274_length_11310_cov_4.717510_7_plen_113_part_00